MCLEKNHSPCFFSIRLDFYLNSGVYITEQKIKYEPFTGKIKVLREINFTFT